MPISSDCPQGRSQHLTFPRRELFQRLASAALLCLVPRPQPATRLKGLPEPEFAIGDLIASDWIDEEDEDAPDPGTDFGEILGMRWPSEWETKSAWDAKTWVYFVKWTRSTIGNSSCYPCYSEEPSRACDLRLVSHD